MHNIIAILSKKGRMQALHLAMSAPIGFLLCSRALAHRSCITTLGDSCQFIIIEPCEDWHALLMQTVYELLKPRACVNAADK